MGSYHGIYGSLGKGYCWMSSPFDDLDDNKMCINCNNAYLSKYEVNGTCAICPVVYIPTSIFNIKYFPSLIDD